MSDPFLPDNSDPETRKATTTRAAARPRPATLAEALLASNSFLPLNERRRENIQKLVQQGSVAVITGQQIGILLGPLFTLYKVLSLLETARAVTKESGVDAIPVFWLQTEDHDFSEIGTTTILSPEGELIDVTLPSEPSPEKVPVAARRLASGTTALIESARAKLSRWEQSPEIFQALLENYKPGRSFSNAFALTLDSLFPTEGIVFIDPRRQEISQLLRPVFQTAFASAEKIAGTLLERGRLLREAGFEEQVHVRPGAPLFFFHAEDGSRHRVDLVQGALHGEGISIAKGEIERLLEDETSRFSTSALLRPVAQDYLLPTACYIGGEAELRYHRQSQAIYPHFDLTPPLVSQRASFLVLEPQAKKLLDELHLQAKDVALSESELADRLYQDSNWLTPSQLKKEIDQRTSELLALLQRNVAALDKSLLGPLQKTQKNVEHAVGVFFDRYGKASLAADEVRLKRLMRLKNMLLPRGEMQERVLSPVSFLCRYGTEFLSRLRKEIEPFRTILKEVEL